jgi:hypothetical protein
MKKTILLSIFLFSGIISYSQRVLLEETVDSDTIEAKWGQNLRHFGHLYMGLGFAASGAEKGAEVMYGNSGNFDFGYRYKFKVCNYYALGADLSYTTHWYRLKQDEDTKILPDSVEHDKERFDIGAFRLEIYQRFNFGKRGNHIGNYIDIGAYGSYFMYTRHYTMDKDPDWMIPEVKKLEETETGPEYMENMEYGVSVRAGNGRWVVFGKYRLSDLFKTTNNYPEKYPELPALQIGFEVGLFD